MTSRCPRKSDARQNRFTYVNGDPINLRDPSGHGIYVPGIVVAIAATPVATAEEGVRHCYMQRVKGEPEGQECSPRALAFLSAVLASKRASRDEPESPTVYGSLPEAQAACDEQLAELGEGSAFGGGIDRMPACVEAAYRFFTANGFTEEQAAGLVANMAFESGMNPRERQRNGPARGLVQWEPARYSNLEEFAAMSGDSPTAFRVQLNFVLYEFAHEERTRGDHLRTITDVDEATEYLGRRYERAGAIDESLEARQRFGREILQRYGSSQ